MLPAPALARQDANASQPTQAGTSSANDGPDVLIIVLMSIVGVGVVVTFGVLGARLYLRRRRDRMLALGGAGAAGIPREHGVDDLAAMSPAGFNHEAAAAAAVVADHFLLAGMPHAAPPPAVVRMQRYVQSSGLSVDELDKVAPLVQFRPDFLRVKSGAVGADNDGDGDGDGDGDVGGDVGGDNAQPVAGGLGSDTVKRDPLNDDRDDDDDEDDDDDDARRTEKLDADDCDDSTCAVCLDEMDTDDKVRCLPCGHVFHGQCIEEWVTKVNRCPVCNTHVVSEDALQKARMGAREGRESASSLTRLALNGSGGRDPGSSGGGGGRSGRSGSGRVGSNTRQRRRRARGENGVFELQHTASATRLSAAISASTASTSRVLSSARARGAAVLGGGSGSSGNGNGNGHGNGSGSGSGNASGSSGAVHDGAAAAT